MSLLVRAMLRLFSNIIGKCEGWPGISQCNSAIYFSKLQKESACRIICDHFFCITDLPAGLSAEGMVGREPQRKREFTESLNQVF